MKEFPKQVFAIMENGGGADETDTFVSYADELDDLCPSQGEPALTVAVYKFDRMVTIKQTITMEDVKDEQAK